MLDLTYRSLPRSLSRYLRVTISLSFDRGTIEVVDLVNEVVCKEVRQVAYEFRMELEPASAYYSALRHDHAALASIEQSLELLRDITYAHRHREDADYAFHIAIARAANNFFILSSMEALREHTHVGMKLHGLSLLRPAGDLAGVFEEHRAIYSAIRERKADDAREQMRQHIKGSYDRLFEGKGFDLSL